MRLVPGLAALFLLGGCWSGPAWFSAGEAVAVIPDGKYRLVETGASPLQGDVIGIAGQADGTLAVSGADNPVRAVIVPLDAARGGDRYIVQLEQIAEHPRNALYMLLDSGGGRYRLSLLRCTREAAQTAERTGGQVSRFQRNSMPPTGAEAARQMASSIVSSYSGGAQPTFAPRGPVVRVTRGKDTEAVPVSGNSTRVLSPQSNAQGK